MKIDRSSEEYVRKAIKNVVEPSSFMNQIMQLKINKTY